MAMFESKKLYYFAQLIRLDKPVGSLLLLWPTLWGLWTASSGQPLAFHLVVFIIGVFIMRSAGCIINDIADRNVDPHVARTQHRPLAAKNLTLQEAILFFIFLSCLGLILVLQLNLKAILFSLGALSFIIIYPFLKRYTNLPQFFLGATFSWSIPMAYAAELGHTNLVCWLLLIANLSWVSAYDTMYGMVDREDDLKIGVKSTAILFADKEVIIINILNLFCLFLLIIIGHLLSLNNFYFIGLFFASLFFVYQYCLIKTRERDKCFKAFLNNTWFGATVFLSFVLGYLP